MRIDIVKADEYTAIYIDGQLKASGNGIPLSQMLTVMGVKASIHEADCAALEEDGGDFPLDLADVPIMSTVTI